MSNRHVDVKRIATSKPETFLQVSVSYDEGVIDTSGYRSRPRGFYVHVGVIEDHNDGFIKHILGNGGRGLLETATRFNQKRMKQLADMADNPENRALDHIVATVLVRNGLKLLVEAEPAEAELVAV
jgi:hypothetical protein